MNCATLWLRSATPHERCAWAPATGKPLRSASEMLERQVGQMARLVDDLLDMSRITRGKIELRKEPTELAPIVEQAVEAVGPLYQSMNHELTVTLPPTPVHVHADPARLAQVVGNLLNNACKFTDKGGRVSLTVEQEGDHALVRVRDNGIGIAAEHLSRSLRNVRCKWIHRWSGRATVWASA